MRLRFTRSMPAALAMFAGLMLVLVSGWPGGAIAGVLSKEDIQRRFGAPYEVQEMLSDVPAWPVTSSLEKEVGPVAYVFESADIAPLPGFEGSPMNFLIAIDRNGVFMDVEVLQQREPVFTFRDLGGLGDTPLREFIGQYAGKSLNQPFVIALDAARNKTGSVSSASVGHATLDGIAKATTSVRIVNQTVLTSALAVARARLGFSAQAESRPPARPIQEILHSLDFDELVAQGMVKHFRVLNREVEALFEGTDGAGQDPEALTAPDTAYVDLYVAYLNAPTIGVALLGKDQYKRVMSRNFDDQQLWWVGASGRFRLINADFTPGTQSPFLSLSQFGGFADFRDQAYESIPVDAAISLDESRIFGVREDSGIDPASPVSFVLTITRSKGSVLPEFFHQQLSLEYQPPEELFIRPEAPMSELALAWFDRKIDLIILSLSLVVLVIFLARPRWISVNPARLAWFRMGFLAYTLCFIGWYAQGQLSVVHVTAAIKSLLSGNSLYNYLYDPVCLVLLVFTLVTFFIWGRGTFCGWLCPFGALQEFVGKIAQCLHLPQLKLSGVTTRRMEKLRYGALAMLIGAALFFPWLGEKLNEVEPFKTSITVAFDRGWPFVAYAVGLLAAGAIYYKFFCRFICPLGAAMSIGGHLRLLDWLRRRKECGKPCQRCTSACQYGAIEETGQIRYDNCFQCLDCVGIYHDENRCVPLILFKKKGVVLSDR